MLMNVKKHLEQKATEDLSLAQSGYNPSMIDALGYVFSKAEQQWEVEQTDEGEDEKEAWRA